MRLLSVVPVTNPGSLKQRYNYDSTPHSEKPFCPNAPGNAKCEQWKPCQVPPDFYMSSASYTDEVCDRNTFNPFQCHDVPQVGQAGWRRVCVVPPGGDKRDHSRCTTIEVKP